MSATAVVVAATNKRSSSTLYLIQKGRDLTSRLQAQSQAVGPTKQEQDVIRYYKNKQQQNFAVDGNHTNTPPRSTMSPLAVAAKRLGALYVPQELLPTNKPPILLKTTTAAAASTKTKPNLTDLEEMERKRRAEGEEQDPDAALLDQSYEQLSDEEEEAADYTMNYYESEGDESDGGGGDGGEPTF